jgi:hypothetical protein
MAFAAVVEVLLPPPFVPLVPVELLPLELELQAAAASDIATSAAAALKVRRDGTLRLCCTVHLREGS